MFPILEYTGHDSEEHVVNAIGRSENIGRPMGGLGTGEVGGQFDICGTEVGPGRTVVGGFGDADLGAVNPGDAGKAFGLGASVGVEHPPAFHVRIPDDNWVGCAVKNGIAEERLRRGFAGGFCGLGKGAEGGETGEGEEKRFHGEAREKRVSIFSPRGRSATAEKDDRWITDRC